MKELRIGGLRMVDVDISALRRGGLAPLDVDLSALDRPPGLLEGPEPSKYSCAYLGMEPGPGDCLTCRHTSCAFTGRFPVNGSVAGVLRRARKNGHALPSLRTVWGPVLCGACRHCGGALIVGEGGFRCINCARPPKQPAIDGGNGRTARRRAPAVARVAS